MKRRLLAIIPLSCMILALSSCHKPLAHEEFVIPESFDENKEYNISFWSKQDSDLRQLNIYYQAIDKFNEYYPNIHITMRDFTSYPDIHKEVLLNMAGDATPNVCIGYIDNVATYLESENSVVPLTDFINNEHFGNNGDLVKYPNVGEDGYVSQFLEENKLNGDYYMIPYMRSTEALYINKTFVERLGETIPDGDFVSWDWVWSVCKKAREAQLQGQNITTKGITEKFSPLVYKSSDNWLIQYAKQANIPYTDESGNLLLFNDKTKEFLLDLKSKARVIYDKNDYTNPVSVESDNTILTNYYELFEVTSHYPGDLINVWDAVFGIDSTAGATWIGYDRPNDQATSSSGCEAFETVIKAVPQVDVNNPYMISQGPSICVFNKSDKDEVVASWLFAQFLTTNYVQLLYQSTEGYLPVTNNCLQSEDFRSYLDGTKQINGSYIYSVAKQVKELLMNNLDHTFITAVFNGSADVRSAAKYLVKSIGNTTKNFATSEGIDKLFEKAIKNYDLGSIKSGNNSGSNQAIAVESKNIGVEGIILLATIGIVWVGIICYVGYGWLKNKKRKNNKTLSNN